MLAEEYLGEFIIGYVIHCSRVMGCTTFSLGMILECKTVY